MPGIPFSVRFLLGHYTAQTIINLTNADQVTTPAYWEQPSLSELSCSANGRMLAATSSNGIYLYDLQNLTKERFLPIPANVNSVAFSPDGQMLATGSTDALIRLWQLSDGTLLDTLSGHTDSVWNVTFSPDGETLASASLDHTIRLWQVDEGLLLFSLREHSAPVQSVAFSPDGQTLASASDDKTIHLWRVVDGSGLAILTGHDDTV
jgi:WD40 repeat protein